MNELKVNAKSVTVDDETIINRMIEDIRESDSDMLESIIESMYPVKAKCEDGLIEIKLDENEVDEETTLKDIF